MQNELSHIIIKQALSFVLNKCTAALQDCKNDLVAARTSWQFANANKMLENLEGITDYRVFYFLLNQPGKTTIKIALNELRKFYFDKYNHDHYGAAAILEVFKDTETNNSWKCSDRALVRTNNNCGLAMAMPTMRSFFSPEKELTR